MFTCGNEAQETYEAQGRSRKNLDNSLEFSKAHIFHIALGSDEKDIYL